VFKKEGWDDLIDLGIESIKDFYEKVDDTTKIKYVLTEKMQSRLRD
jgi:hypothetical protein